ncbi:MAG: hypothetical protein LKF75_02670 [Bacilli bacterium]|jgi:hypothetical protein|nr:hypothetical protein [Bacilli bacterium]MCH4210785.1 hypothetical protein [Bacilli bacterium]MCH4228590.1 hypothetical protein [Bacilli bacterium]MCH4277882.1 hypothetical protein [Bacilli bacterium]MCI2055309.1 hypothetical protein [Bacilli bacterium]
MERKEENKLKPSYRHLLASILLLKEDGYEATMEGLAKVLLGIEDEETVQLTRNLAFASRPSLNKKKIKARIHSLIRHGYVKLVYSDEDDDYYLRLSEKALQENLDYPSEAKNREKTKTKRSIRAIAKE